MNAINELTPPSLKRIQSVDLLRGAVMIIMAIDHVRVYAGIPAGGPLPSIFFTRWITHFCAPTFAFFAGTSAFLYFQKTGSHKKVFNFLTTRGILLVIFELTLVRFAWMFNLNFSDFTMTGVIWMLGWCMIIFGGFIWLRPITVTIIGLVIIFAQQVFHYFPVNIFPSAYQGLVSSIWGFFYPSLIAVQPTTSISPGLPALPTTMGISIFYVILPWLGVMMAGYGFGQLLIQRSELIKKVCVIIGTTSILVFIAVGTIKIFSWDQSTSNLPFLLNLLNQQKYPPSQLYILMTLGPVILLTPWAERVRGKLVDAVRIVGKVPMFYYLLHIPLIHLSALIVNLMLSGSAHQEWYTTAPFVLMDKDQQWNLALLYLVWSINVVILYFASRWYVRYKSNTNQIWTKYI